jgi:monoamine oxidase
MSGKVHYATPVVRIEQSAQDVKAPFEHLPYLSASKIFLQSKQRFWVNEGLSGFATTDDLSARSHLRRGDTLDKVALLSFRPGGRPSR